jgi:hypothetical protein
MAPSGRHDACWAEARAGRGQSCGGGGCSRFSDAMVAVPVPVPGWEGAYWRGVCCALRVVGLVSGAVLSRPAPSPRMTSQRGLVKGTYAE